MLQPPDRTEGNVEPFTHTRQLLVTGPDVTRGLRVFVYEGKVYVCVTQVRLHLRVASLLSRLG